ncbi:hypothetical protein NMG60_11015015 [Bertholletia excelsa]
MERSKSSSNDDGAIDKFFFYDSLDVSDQPVSNSCLITLLGTDDDVSIKPSPSSVTLSPAGLRYRRSLSQNVAIGTSADDSESSSLGSSICFGAAASAEKKYRDPGILKEKEKGPKKTDSCHSADKEFKNNSSVTTGNDERLNERATVVSASIPAEESGSNFLFLLAGWMIKAVGFKVKLPVNFIIFPIWFLYRAFMFVIDPFQIVIRNRKYLMKMPWKNVILANKWLKEHGYIWKMGSGVGWGFLWITFLCVILTGLLVSTFVVSGFIVRYLAEEPIQMKEMLTFDYTKNNPVSFVRFTSCPSEPCGEGCRENSEVGKTAGPRAIPPKHKLQATVSLILPDSDYNQNLGIFHV